MIGKVVKLFITKENSNKKRESVHDIEVTQDGVKNDKFYAKDLQRAILITSTDSYEISKKNDIDLEDGALGENILIDINPYGLNPGDRIHISDVVLEITQNCTLCKGLSMVDSKLPKLLKNDRGIFAKVISNPGKISLGDKVEILNY